MIVICTQRIFTNNSLAQINIPFSLNLVCTVNFHNVNELVKRKVIDI